MNGQVLGCRIRLPDSLAARCAVADLHVFDFVLYRYCMHIGMHTAITQLEPQLEPEKQTMFDRVLDQCILHMNGCDKVVEAQFAPPVVCTQWHGK